VTALLDTGFLLAILNKEDDWHPACVRVLAKAENLVLPDFVIPELAYLVLRELGYTVLIQFLDAVLNGEFVVERTRPEDLKRVNELGAFHFSWRFPEKKGGVGDVHPPPLPFFRAVQLI
jgi:predicted nucleic acid-binding protein